VQVWALCGAITGVSLTGVFLGMKAFLLSVAVVVVAVLLVPVSVTEFVARRIAEFDKGPLVALGVLVAAALTFFKTLL
jgi:hypothetical protein